MKDMNKAMLMEIAWNMRNDGSDELSMFFLLEGNCVYIPKRKYMNTDGEIINYYRAASLIWSGIKNALREVDSRSQWLIGNGDSVDFGERTGLVVLLSNRNCNLKPKISKAVFLKLQQLLSKSDTAWKLLNNCAATDSKVQKKGIKLASRCMSCRENCEDLHHLLWGCNMVENLWQRLTHKFKTRMDFSNFKQAISKMKGRSPLLRHIWTTSQLWWEAHGGSMET
ncbi:hypothetical protein IFM89_040010 [Coptis chinensis]|uniref:Reverse transcriptase zinc-binding domain-containing protein n=1 Tax=Coptis chinensis TaxID=261450 RepID=A0A835GSM7_9MAGN|nr:hypothetical protein IFM89_040010 [Coptis chinensis]